VKRLLIKHSSLDAQAPPGVEIIIRLLVPGRVPAPLGDYETIAAAQAASDKLTKERVYHSFLTWWRMNGRHVHKWPTLMKGKRRFFRVSVPYVAGVSDDMVKAMLRRAILDAQERPAQYTSESVKVTIDNKENQTEMIVPLTDQKP